MNLSATLIQTDVHWLNIEANLAMLEEKIWQIEGETDIIILPEMFTTGFTNEAASLAEPMNSKTFRWMKQMAAQTQALLIGSYIVKENQHFYNRLLWMEPDGSFAHYDKHHLFRMSEEHAVYTPGQELLIKYWKGWNVCPLICYDLRFPVWSRNRLKADGTLSYDLLICVANWPAVRSDVWMTLLRARAIENASCVVGVNRVGEDGNGIAYDGNSVVMNAQGDISFREVDKESVATVALSYDDLMTHRRQFPVHLDADDFSLKN